MVLVGYNVSHGDCNINYKQATPTGRAPVEQGEGQMGEMSAWINRKDKFSTAILQYPSGRYGIVGRVPVVLSIEEKDYRGITRKSMSWGTEAEAIAALVGAGVERFQLADCSWYGE